MLDRPTVPYFPAVRFTPLDFAGAAGFSPIAARIAESAKRPCCRLFLVQCAFSFERVPFDIRTKVSNILVLMGADGNTRFFLLTACPHRKLILAARKPARKGGLEMTGEQIFREELRKRRLWSRGATNAIVILQTLITEDCTMSHRLKMIDLMCHIDGVIWI
jgi:hypothetical protein